MNKSDTLKWLPLQSGGCFQYISRRADSAVQAILSGPGGYARILTDKAREQMKSQLFQRLSYLYMDVLSRQLLEEVEADQSQEDMLAVLFRAVDRLGDRLDQTDGREIYGRYPLLADVEKRITDHFIEGQKEFLARFSDSREAISKELLGGSPVNEIRSLHHWGSPRWKSRTAVGVETDAGNIYYKPRDCRLDAFYQYLMETVFPGCIAAPRVVTGGGYGFCSEIRPDPLQKPEEAAAYFRNLGMLMAVFHCLNGNDLGCPNIIACAQIPAAIDVETLFAPQWNNADTGVYTDAERYLYTSVAFTGTLPRWDAKDQKIRSVLHAGEETGDWLPFYGGEYRDVTGLEEELIAGFREGYRRMLDRREQMLSVLEDSTDMMVRVMYGNLDTNQLILEKMVCADILEMPGKMDALRSFLFRSFAGMDPEHREILCAYGMECLKEGEIPCYSAQMGSRALFGKDVSDMIAPDMLRQSPLEHLRERFSRMSAYECDMNEHIIRWVLRHLAGTGDGSSGKKETADPQMPAEYQIFRELTQDSVRTPDGTRYWYSESYLKQQRRMIGLCSLQAEAAAYCALLLHRQGSVPAAEAGKVQEVLENSLTAIRDKITKWESGGGRMDLPSGLHQGLGGLILDLDLMEMLLDSGVQDCADQLLTLLSGDNLLLEGVYGLMDGTAGLLVSLCLMPVRKDPRAEHLRFRAIRTLGDDLLRVVQDPGQNSSFFRNPDPFCGVTGAGMALILAAKQLKDRERSGNYAQTGEAIFEMIRKESAMDHFAEGIGLCAAAALYAQGEKAASPPFLQQCLRDALRTASGHDCPAESDFLYHGNSLRALFWYAAGILADEPSYPEKAKGIIEDMITRRSRGRDHFDASLWLGDTGIGMTIMICGLLQTQTAADIRKRDTDGIQ